MILVCFYANTHKHQAIWRICVSVFFPWSTNNTLVKIHRFFTGRLCCLEPCHRFRKKWRHKQVCQCWRWRLYDGTGWNWGQLRTCSFFFVTKQKHVVFFFHSLPSKTEVVLGILGGFQDVMLIHPFFFGHRNPILTKIRIDFCPRELVTSYIRLKNPEDN